MSEERLAILKMVAEGTISPEEGEKLLKALNEGEQKRKESKSFHDNEYNSPFENGDRESDWEKSFERSMEEFGRKIEKHAEAMGREFGRKAERMAEDFAINFGGIFEGFDKDRHEENVDSGGTIRFPGISDWNLAPGLEGSPMDYSHGNMDLSDIKGLALFTKEFEPHEKCQVDLTVNQGRNSLCLVEKDAVMAAVKRNGWVIIGFDRDTSVTIPSHLEKFGVLSYHGDIYTHSLIPQLLLSTMKGDIESKDVSRTMKADTYRGDIVIGIHPDFRGSIELNTMKGDMGCYIPAEVNLEFTAKSAKGEMSTFGPGIEIKAEYHRPMNNLMTGTVGKGGPDSLSLNTMKGDIRIKTSLKREAKS